MEICVAKRSVLFYSLKLIKLKQFVELTFFTPYSLHLLLYSLP